MSHKLVPPPERCQGWSMEARLGAFPCHLRGTITEEGKRWCRYHAPSLVAAQRAKRHAEWEQKFAAKREVAIAVDRQRAEDDRKLAAFPDLLAACENAVATLEIGPTSSTNFASRMFVQVKAAETALRLAIAKAKEETYE